MVGDFLRAQHDLVLEAVDFAVELVCRVGTERQRFATKPKLATRMIARAIAASVPFKWVAGDTVYGVGDIEQQLRRAGKGYVLGVNSAHVFRSWGKRRPVAGTAADIARTRRSSDWKRLSAGAGTKGPRLHDWCYLELADLEVGESIDANPGLWTRGLLIRRRIADDDLAFFTTWCPAGTSIETLVAVEGHRWAIEDSFETAKNEFGLDHNESRSWHGWHRHVSMVMLAFAMMAAIRHRANPPPPKKTSRRWIDMCEAGGVDSIWQTDRIVGHQPFLDIDHHDGGPGRAHAAHAVRHERRVAGVPRPVLLAKQCATIDMLSDGRLLPAFGIGRAHAVA